MRKQARPQAESSRVGRDDEQGNEGLPEEISVIKAAEGLDVTTQRGHAQTAVFSHRRDVAGSVIRTKKGFIDCDRSGDITWRSCFPDLHGGLHRTGNAPMITCAMFNGSSVRKAVVELSLRSTEEMEAMAEGADVVRPNENFDARPVRQVSFLRPPPQRAGHAGSSWPRGTDGRVQRAGVSDS